MYDNMIKEEVEDVIFKYSSTLKSNIGVSFDTLNDFLEEININKISKDIYQSHIYLIARNFGVIESEAKNDDIYFAFFMSDFKSVLVRSIKDIISNWIKASSLDIDKKREELVYYKLKQFQENYNIIKISNDTTSTEFNEIAITIDDEVIEECKEEIRELELFIRNCKALCKN